MATQYHLIEVGLNPKQIKILQDCIDKGETCVFKLSKNSIEKPNTKLMVNAVKYRKYVAAKETGKGFHLKLNKKELQLNKKYAGSGISSTTIKCKECGNPLHLGKGITDSLKSMGSKVLEDPSNMQSTVSESLQGLKSDPRVAVAMEAADKGFNVASKIADEIDKTGKAGTTLLEINKYVKDMDAVGLLNFAIDQINDAINGKSKYDAQQASKNFNNAISQAKAWLISPEAMQRNSYEAKLEMVQRSPPFIQKFLVKGTPSTFEEYKAMMQEIANRTPMTTSQKLQQHRTKLGLGMKKPSKPKGQKKSLPDQQPPEKLITAQSVMKLRNHLSMNQQN